MPQVAAERTIALDQATVFALSQSSGAFRMRWDPFIHSQRFEDGATAAGKGVRTRTRSRLGLLMTSAYVSYKPPGNVGMTMVKGPWFFEQFGGGWRFATVDGGTKAVWKYTSRAGRCGCGGLPIRWASGCLATKSRSELAPLLSLARIRPWLPSFALLRDPSTGGVGVRSRQLFYPFG